MNELSVVWKKLTGNAKYHQKHTRVSCRVLVRGINSPAGVSLTIPGRQMACRSPSRRLQEAFAGGTWAPPDPSPPPAGTWEMNPGNRVDEQPCSSAVSSPPRLEESLKNRHCRSPTSVPTRPAPCLPPTPPEVSCSAASSVPHTCTASQ